MNRLDVSTYREVYEAVRTVLRNEVGFIFPAGTEPWVGPTVSITLMVDDPSPHGWLAGHHVLTYAPQLGDTREDIADAMTRDWCSRVGVFPPITIMEEPGVEDV